MAAVDVGCKQFEVALVFDEINLFSAFTLGGEHITIKAFAILDHEGVSCCLTCVTNSVAFFGSETNGVVVNFREVCGKNRFIVAVLDGHIIVVVFRHVIGTHL